MSGDNFIAVNVSIKQTPRQRLANWIDGREAPLQSLKMEKGTVFQNNGFEYRVNENGVLQKRDLKTTIWTEATSIEMTNYQWNVFQNVMDNDGNAGTYSLADIDVINSNDLQKDLPQGYRIDSLNKGDVFASVHVTNGEPSTSSTLLFGATEDARAAFIADKKEAIRIEREEAGLPTPKSEKKVADKFTDDNGAQVIVYEDGSKYSKRAGSNGYMAITETFPNGSPRIEHSQSYIGEARVYNTVIRNEKGVVIYGRSWDYRETDGFENKYDDQNRLVSTADRSYEYFDDGTIKEKLWAYGAEGCYEVIEYKPDGSEEHYMLGSDGVTKTPLPLDIKKFKQDYDIPKEIIITNK